MSDKLYYVVRQIRDRAIEKHGRNINCYFLYTWLKKYFPTAKAMHDGNHVMTIIGNLIVDKNSIYIVLDELEEKRFIERGRITND